jgi:hypothetical protein
MATDPPEEADLLPLAAAGDAAAARDLFSRYRARERPPLSEYINGHPDLAGEIREVFPAMAMMENIGLTEDRPARPGPAPPPAAPPFVGMYREAVTSPERARDASKGVLAAFDLYFLAMARARFGEWPKAREHLAQAIRWHEEHKSELSAQHQGELTDFRAEAEALIEGR